MEIECYRNGLDEFFPIQAVGLRERLPGHVYRNDLRVIRRRSVFMSSVFMSFVFMSSVFMSSSFCILIMISHYRMTCMQTKLCSSGDLEFCSAITDWTKLLQ